MKKPIFRFIIIDKDSGRRILIKSKEEYKKLYTTYMKYLDSQTLQNS